jgi:hypothetical protein
MEVTPAAVVSTFLYGTLALKGYPETNRR